LDPDIVAALDDDFNFDDPDNELEDDFIAFANGVPSDVETEYVLETIVLNLDLLIFIL
jgi:protein LTV1